MHILFANNLRKVAEGGKRPVQKRGRTKGAARAREGGSGSDIEVTLWKRANEVVLRGHEPEGERNAGRLSGAVVACLVPARLGEQQRKSPSVRCSRAISQSIGTFPALPYSEYFQSQESQ